MKAVDAGSAVHHNRRFYPGVKAVNPKAEVKQACSGSFDSFVKAADLAQTNIKAWTNMLTGASQQVTGALTR